MVEGARDDLARSVITAHRVDGDRDALCAASRPAEPRPGFTSRAVADRVDHGQEADSFVDCLISIAWRPLYQPQFLQT
jgi:hypothetical protein